MVSYSSRARRIGGRRHDADVEQQIARRIAGQSLAAHPELPTGLRAGGDAHLDRSGRQVDGDEGTQRGFPGRHRQIRMQIAAVDAKPRVGPKLHFQQQVSGRRAPQARLALTGQTDHLSIAHPFRNPDAQVAGLEAAPALCVEFGHPQRDLPGGASEAVLEIQQDLGMMVLATGVAPATLAPAHASEHLREEIRKVSRFAGVEAVARKFETGIPARRWPEFLSGLGIGAQLVVGGASFRVGQHRIGLVDLLHARFRVGFLGDVRVVLARQLAKGALYFGCRRIPRHAENAVVILVLHASAPSGP